MKRVLLLAPYFVPRRRVGAMRPFRFAMHLREYGWEPTVLTLATSEGQLTAREERALEGVEIISLESPFDRTSTSESDLSSKAASGVSANPGVVTKTARAIDRQFPVDTWLPLFVLKYRAIDRLVRRIQPDVIWATGDPWSSLVTAGRLARRHDIPFVADFRDPWTLCQVRTDGRWNLSRQIDRRYERRVLERASVVLFQARQTEALYRQHYPDLETPTTTITNSFSRSLMSDGDETVRPNPPLDEANLNLCFFGRFRAYSPASVVAEALALARQKNPDLVSRIRIHSTGDLNPADEEFAQQKGVSDCFVRQASVPLESSVDLLRQFDVLLLSTDLRRPEIIPAKLFEYLAAERPILSLSLNPEVDEIIRQTGSGAQFDPRNVDQVADLLLASASAKAEGARIPLDFNPSRAKIEHYEARETTRELAGLFDSLVG